MGLDEGSGFFSYFCSDALTSRGWAGPRSTLDCSTEVQGDFAFDFNDIMKWATVLCVRAHQRDEEANLFFFVWVKIHNRDSSWLTAQGFQ